MSIFPKRTIPGQNVTIHWNLHAPALSGEHLYPFVRIGVRDPRGNTIMLFEGHIPVLPSIGAPVSTDAANENTLLYLNKNTPLLVLASYLSGRQKRERLIKLLENIQSGRHHYFTYPVPADALPGKYSLLSEIHIDGITKYSGTAEEDFFYVESINIDVSVPQTAMLTNLSPELLPIKILFYEAGRAIQSSDVQVFELKGNESKPISLDAGNMYLCYNEERIIIPLSSPAATHSIRNQQLLTLHKKEETEEAVYVMHKDEDISFRLTGVTKEIWLKADGLITRQTLRTENQQNEYDEMLANKLIIEI
jgi:hypothetical protein